MIGNTNYRFTKTWKKVFFMLSLFFGVALFSDNSVYAHGTTAEIVLPVMQEFTIDNTTDESVNKAGSYELAALETDCPMPEGSTDGKYAFILTDDEQIELLFSYAQDGVYRYHIKQTTVDEKQYTYDRTVYSISVYIENDENGQLISQVIVENANGEKCEKLLFKNVYTGKESSVNDQPDKQKPQQSDSLKTGDMTNVTLYMAMLLMAFATIFVISYIQKKNRRIRDNN